MVRAPVVVTADATLAEFMDDVAYAHAAFTTYPVLENGCAIGLLPFACVARVPRNAWENSRLAFDDCMLRREDVPTVREDENLLEALDQINAGGINRALVMDDGRLEGLLSITDVVLDSSPGRRPGTRNFSRAGLGMLEDRARRRTQDPTAGRC